MHVRGVDNVYADGSYVRVLLNNLWLGELFMFSDGMFRSQVWTGTLFRGFSNQIFGCFHGIFCFSIGLRVFW